MTKVQTTYRLTDHGINVANEIIGEDVYGASGQLNPADVHRILDCIHSNILQESNGDKLQVNDPTSDGFLLLELLSHWMNTINRMFEIDN